MREVTSGTALAASADHAVIGFAAPGISSGPWSTYKVATQTFTDSEADAEVTRIAVDRTGAQFALPRRFGIASAGARLR
jgi:hypothetical protein